MEKQIKVYWLVLIVLSTIFTFVFIQIAKHDDDLVLYFGFAGSVTSLVLGLIAIFYSMITNEKSSGNIEKLSDAVDKIQQGAKAMSDFTQSINERLDKISDDVIRFGTKNDSNQKAPKQTAESEEPMDSEVIEDEPDELKGEQDA